MIGYIVAMAIYSTEEASHLLDKLIDRALNGEEVKIERGGQTVIQFTPIRALPRVVTDADWEWLSTRRVGHNASVEDARILVSRLHDEEWDR